MKNHRLTAIFLAVFAIAAQAATYVITGSGTSFTAVKNGSETVGEAGKAIQSVIDAIKADAAEADCTIQFGDGDVLDIGEESIIFEGDTFEDTHWGLITLEGKITSESDSFTIIISRSSLEMTEGSVANTSNGNAIKSISGSSVSISGGTVLATTSAAIYSSWDAGLVTISGTAKITSAGFNSATIYIASYGDNPSLLVTGGIIENTAEILGSAIYNEYSGEINISGGEIKAAGAHCSAVDNYGSGTVNISGGTLSSDDWTIYNQGTGTINISGGTILVKDGYDGYVVYNNWQASIILTGGLVFAYGASIEDIIDGDYDATEGNAVIVAWDKAANNTIYAENASNDIAKFPATATAVWDLRGGIAYANGTNTGFLEIEGVTVEAEPTDPIRHSQIASGNIRVQATTNAIVLENLPRNAKVEVYNLQGKQVYSTTSHSPLATSHLKIGVQTKGIYIVKASTQTMRVAVR
jgi:hypothetical protein